MCTQILKKALGDEQKIIIEIVFIAPFYFTDLHKKCIVQHNNLDHQSLHYQINMVE
jgi:hypothetical protein